MTEPIRRYEPAQLLPIAKALASDVRLAILTAVGTGPHTISQLAAKLGITQPAATTHVRILEDAGLLTISQGTGERGTTKICNRSCQEILLRLSSPPDTEARQQTVLSMPVGGFSRCQILPTCGLASRESIIGFIDDPRAFYLPERSTADILWFGGAGYVEYDFPNVLLRGQPIDRIELALEICSEAPGFNSNYPSEITFAMNGHELGSWTCPGDMGEQRGPLNPGWWSDRFTQYGFLKTLVVSQKGCFIDGWHVSDRTPQAVLEHHGPALTLRISVKDDAHYRGGITLCGKGFGNYPQDILLTLVSAS